MHLVIPPGGCFHETRRIELGAGVLTIGRAESCDVRIDVPGVDAEHAQISAVEFIAVGPDCAVGDVPLDAGQRRLITPGDQVQIGSVVLALDGQKPDVGKTQAAFRIRVVEGKNVGGELILAKENHEYVVGRNRNADLVLDDREVSREHLKIVRRGYSVFIYDQASTRGSWLGRSAVYQGSRIDWEWPRMLKLGATVLALDLPEEARRAGPAMKVSAPMTAPPRVRDRPVVPVPEDAGPPPANVIAYHYEAKAPSPQAVGEGPAASAAGAIQNVHPSAPPSVPPSSTAGARKAWKKSGSRIGNVSGLLLLALAGVVILGVLFAVFSLME